MNFDSIFANDEYLSGNKFDEIILNKIYHYKGVSTQELYSKFNVTTDTHSKQINRTLVYRILGVNTDSAEEFEKANIVIKTIRINKHGKPEESMSFPRIKIADIVSKDFYSSYEYEYFETTSKTSFIKKRLFNKR